MLGTGCLPEALISRRLSLPATGDRRFESIFLQRRVCKPSVPQRRSLSLRTAQMPPRRKCPVSDRTTPQLFRRLDVGRVALRTDHRAGWAHPRLRRLRWDGGRGDRDDAAAARTAVLAGPAGGRRLRLRPALHHNRELAQCKGPAGRRIFSIYMVGTFLALALGQLLIGPAEIETAGPFNAIVALFAVALVMVSTRRAEPPRLTAAATLPYGELARAAPVAVVVGALSGLISSSSRSFRPGCRTKASRARRSQRPYWWR